MLTGADDFRYGRTPRRGRLRHRGLRSGRAPSASVCRCQRATASPIIAMTSSFGSEWRSARWRPRIGVVERLLVLADRVQERSSVGQRGDSGRRPRCASASRAPRRRLRRPVVQVVVVTSGIGVVDHRHVVCRGEVRVGERAIALDRRRARAPARTARAPAAGSGSRGTCRPCCARPGSSPARSARAPSRTSPRPSTSRRLGELAAQHLAVDEQSERVGELGVARTPRAPPPRRRARCSSAGSPVVDGRMAVRRAHHQVQSLLEVLGQCRSRSRSRCAASAYSPRADAACSARRWRSAICAPVTSSIGCSSLMPRPVRCTAVAGHRASMFPVPRPRRLRATAAMRELVAETRLDPRQRRRTAVRARGHRLAAADRLVAGRRAAHPPRASSPKLESSPTWASAR